MEDAELEQRRALTFEQAEGTHPLPAQAALHTLSREARALLWKIVYASISKSTEYLSIGEPWQAALYDEFVERGHNMADRFSNGFKTNVDRLRPIFENGKYDDVLGFVQYMLRVRMIRVRIGADVEAALEKSRSAYRVVGGDTIIPVSSPTDVATIERGFRSLQADFQGPHAHLRAAAGFLSEGGFADAVRESIHAVEGVARSLAPTGDLSKALAELERRSMVHGGLKKGFLAIYGYTSDEQGIRHALIDASTPEVDEADALFMLGACSAFVTYLVEKKRASGM